MTGLEAEIKEFADSRWGDRDIAGRIRKLGEEFGELAEAVARGIDNDIFMEASDCGIILADLLALMGKSLTVGMMMKLEINRNREVKG